MDARDSVGHESSACAVPLAMPGSSVEPSADLGGLIYLCIRVRFVLSFVPPPPAEYAHPFVQRLLDIRAKAVLDRGLKRVSGDFRLGCEARSKIVDGLLVVPHVGVIHKSQETKHALLVPDGLPVKFELEIFCPGAGYAGV